LISSDGLGIVTFTSRRVRGRVNASEDVPNYATGGATVLIAAID
jgi:hypothetical protein